MDASWQRLDIDDQGVQILNHGNSSSAQMMHFQNTQSAEVSYRQQVQEDLEEEIDEVIDHRRDTEFVSNSNPGPNFGPPSLLRGLSSDELSREWKYLVTPEQWLSHVESYLRSGHSKLKLQPLDMSCSFSVSDAHAWDLPLIYCSPAFERKTEYPLDHIRGINHRFMQDPQGSQPAGVLREHSDNDAIAEMFDKLLIGQESQVSVKNYTRAGESWQNLLTMVPISVANSGTIDFVIGLQIDSKTYPNNLLEYLPNGFRRVDYRTLQATPVQWPASLRGGSPTAADYSLLMGSQSTIVTDGISKSWSSFLLKNMDDAVFVLSQNGLVLYASPGVVSVLGYSSQTLLGKNLSSCTHPADISNLLSEFWSEQSNKRHTILVRMRRVDGRYHWVEFGGRPRSADAHGNSKHLVLSARLRPCFNFTTSDTVNSGEFWTRISTEGMILFTTAAASRFSGVHRAQLLGAKFTTLLEKTDVNTFYQVLAMARTGTPGLFEHVCVEKRQGTKYSMLSDVYPGIAGESIQTSLLVRTRLANTAGSDNKNSGYRLRLDENGSEGKILSLAPSPFAAISAQFDPNKTRSWRSEYQTMQMTNLKLRKRLQQLRSNA